MFSLSAFPIVLYITETRGHARPRFLFARQISVYQKEAFAVNPLDLTVTVIFLHGDLLKRPHSDVIAVADIPLSALWQSSDHFQNFSFHSHQLVRLLIYQTGQLCQFIEFMRVFGRLRPVTVISLGDGQDSVPCFLFGFHQDVNFMIYVSRPFQKRPCFITHETSPPVLMFPEFGCP